MKYVLLTEEEWGLINRLLKAAHDCSGAVDAEYWWEVSILGSQPIRKTRWICEIFAKKLYPQKKTAKKRNPWGDKLWVRPFLGSPKKAKAIRLPKKSPFDLLQVQVTLGREESSFSISCEYFF